MWGRAWWAQCAGATRGVHTSQPGWLGSIFPLRRGSAIHFSAVQPNYHVAGVVPVLCPPCLPWPEVAKLHSAGDIASMQDPEAIRAATVASAKRTLAQFEVVCPWGSPAMVWGQCALAHRWFDVACPTGPPRRTASSSSQPPHHHGLRIPPMASRVFIHPHTGERAPRAGLPSPASPHPTAPGGQAKVCLRSSQGGNRKPNVTLARIIPTITPDYDPGGRGGCMQGAS